MKDCDPGGETSYFFITRGNIVRQKCIELITASWFESVILILILMSSVKLVWDTYLLGSPDDSTENKVSFAFDIFFTIAFTVEFILKSISLGVVLEPKTYLRDSWNQMDFIIVIISILDLSL